MNPIINLTEFIIIVLFPIMVGQFIGAFIISTILYLYNPHIDFNKMGSFMRLPFYISLLPLYLLNYFIITKLFNIFNINIIICIRSFEYYTYNSLIVITSIFFATSMAYIVDGIVEYKNGKISADIKQKIKILENEK